MHNDVVLKKTAARDISIRSRVSTSLYLVIFSIVIAFTPFYQQHEVFTKSIGVMIILGTIIRGVHTWKFELLYTRNPKMWNIMNSIGTCLQALTWGVLCIVSVYYYEWQWPTMIVCLSAAAFSAGGVTTLSPFLHLAVTYLILMFSPTLIYSIAVATKESLAATFLFTTYLVFLVDMARRLNKEYWSALRNSFLLDKRAKQLEAKNQELESFAYSVSHDLRSPLRAIDGFSQMLLDDAYYRLDEAGRTYLQRIRLAAQRMGCLIDDLLQLSRVSSAKYIPRSLNMSDLIRYKLEKLRQQDPQRQVELDIMPDIYVHGDKSLIDIAMDNLTNNAWKYSSKRIHSKIRFGSRHENGETIYFIKDDGVGFDPQYSNQLFKPFQRLHSDDEFPGTGIGLATVRRIIDRHNGRVWANAKVDKGATFYFTLPGEG